MILTTTLQLYASQQLPAGVREVAPPVKKPYATTPLLPQYKDEQTRYIKDPAQRDTYRLRFGSDGLIYDSTGHRFDTREAVRINENGEKEFLKRAMFVMDAQGNFYASNFQQVGVFHHSSLVGGDAVAASGEMEIIDGELKLLNDRSGHYRCAREFSEQAMDRLRHVLPRAALEHLHIDWLATK